MRGSMRAVDGLLTAQSITMRGPLVQARAQWQMGGVRRVEVEQPCWGTRAPSHRRAQARCGMQGP